MDINYKKLQRQQKGVDRWSNSSLYGANKDYRGTLNYFTGVGKTYTAILIIKKLFRINNTYSIVILVPSDALYKQWTEELSKHFNKGQLHFINIYTPHKIIVNNIKIKCGLLIVDEIHLFYSKEFINIINGKTIQFEKNLALTASYYDRDNRYKQIENLYPVIDEIREEEAIKEGYISPFIEFNVGVELTEKEREAYERFSKVIKNNINKFGKGGLKLAQKCLSGDGKKGKYSGKQYCFGWAKHNGWSSNLDMTIERDREIDNIWNPNTIFGYAINLMKAIKHRKDILYKSENKLKACIDIINHFEDKKILVFSQSTEFADDLGSELNIDNPDRAVVFHSQLETTMMPSPKTGKLIKFGKTRLRKRALKRFKENTSRIICTASSLDTGFDDTSVDIGITASGTSNYTQYKQRGGRVKRLNILKPDKVALIINLYAIDTQDEVWLKKRQSKSSHGVYWTNEIKDISYNPVVENDINIDNII